MEKLTQIISKEIYCLNNGKKVGYILNIFFSAQLDKVNGFIIVDDESFKTAFIPVDKVSFGAKFAFIKSLDCLTYGEFGDCHNPVHKLVFTDKFDDLGIILDVFFQKSRVLCLITSKMTFFPRQISVAGDAVILGKKKQNLSAQNVFKPNGNEVIVSVSSAINEVVTTPIRLASDERSLIGKSAMRDVFGLNNELIIRKYEIIDQKKINIAKKHNKLNMLFYSCK